MTRRAMPYAFKVFLTGTTFQITAVRTPAIAASPMKTQGSARICSKGGFTTPRRVIGSG